MKKLMGWFMVLAVAAFLTGCGEDETSKPIEKKPTKSAADPK